MYHTVKLYFKDGKYKYEITEFSGQYYDGGVHDVDIINNLFKKNNRKKEDYNIFLETINYYVTGIIQSLKTTMSMPLTTKDF